MVWVPRPGQLSGPGRAQKEHTDATVVGTPPPQFPAYPLLLPLPLCRHCGGRVAGRSGPVAVGRDRAREIGRWPQGGSQPSALLGKGPRPLPPTPNSLSQPQGPVPIRPSGPAGWSGEGQREFGWPREVGCGNALTTTRQLLHCLPLGGERRSDQSFWSLRLIYIDVHIVDIGYSYSFIFVYTFA